MESATNAPESDTIDFIELLRAVWGYKYLIAASVVIFALGATVLALTATPIFRAQAVVVEVEGPNAAGGVASVFSQLGGLANLAGINLSSSRGNGQARAVLESRLLVEDFLVHDGRLEEFRRQWGETRSPWHAVKRLQEEVLSIQQNNRNGRITVAVEGKDPALCAEWANAFVELANERVRTQAIEEAEKNIAYLHTQISGTSVVELRRVMYDLVQSETQTLMLANARQDYAFRVVDPAIAPEERVRPQRTLMVIIGTVLGGFAGLALALIWHFVRANRRSRA